MALRSGQTVSDDGIKVERAAAQRDQGDDPNYQGSRSHINDSLNVLRNDSPIHDTAITTKVKSSRYLLWQNSATALITSFFRAAASS